MDIYTFAHAIVIKDVKNQVFKFYKIFNMLFILLPTIKTGKNRKLFDKYKNY